MKHISSLLLKIGLCALTLASVHAEEKKSWWNPEWTLRKKIVVDTTSAGGGISDPVGGVAVLLRLHDGTFQFAAAKEDGSDIRFLAADDKTPLSYHVEKFDSLVSEAFVWVKIPDVKPNAQVSFWMYYGNGGPTAIRAEDVKGTYDAETILVYHFAGKDTAPADSSPSGNTATTAGVTSSGAMIGSGARLDGRNTIALPVSPSLAVADGGSLTWAAWIKPNVLAPNAVLFSRRDGAGAFLIGVDNGVPYVEITKGGSTERTPAGAPLAATAWRHLGVTAGSGKVTVYVDGENYGTLNADLPALNTAAYLGADGPDDTKTKRNPGFVGEIDELQMFKSAKPAGFLKFLGLSQGDKAAKLVQYTSEESQAKAEKSALAEHLSLFGDIAGHMQFDGWMVIFFCCIMAAIGWTVAINKFFYLAKIQKGNDEFLRQWKNLSSDLTLLDQMETDKGGGLGGKASPKMMKVMRQSPLYHIYHIGAEEIRHRIKSKSGFSGLSSRSIQAIKASLDSGLTHEVHRLNSGLIFLTISIAGGPYLGLLGTVMGVMITFAVISKSGEVEVASIAPGIASALLATVFGLLVAIPALFIYSFLNTQIKDTVSKMQLFIDEFIAKMAEFYRPTSGRLRASEDSESQAEEMSAQ